MALRSLLGRARRDRALVIGLLGGAVTSLTGIVAYFLVPYLRGDVPNLGEALVSGAMEFFGFSPVYHVFVLVVVPFVCTVVGVLVARRQGLSGQAIDAKIVGGIVLLPFVTALALFIVTVVGIGVYFGLGPEMALYERVMVAVGVAFLGLAIGAIFGIFIAAVVLLGESAGAGAGYLLARRLTRRG